MPIDVHIPDTFVESILKDCQPVIDAALSVADDVPEMARDYAIKNNQDAYGNQMHPKKPRPKGNPTNHPETPLIQNDTPDEMNPDRWEVVEVSDTERQVIYHPSEHHVHLEDKAPSAGGRKWISKGQINPNLRAEIEAEMLKRANKEL